MLKNKLMVRVDKNFSAMSANLVWKTISGPVLLLFIPIFLSGEEQGYWFSFINVAAFIALMDLGFSTMILQLSAHEFAHLKIENGLVKGPFEKISKLGSLLKFALKWSSGTILVAAPGIYFLGSMLFKVSVGVNWSTPWLLYLCGIAISYFGNVVLLFIQGFDKVGETEALRFLSLFLYTISLVYGLNAHLKLYALALASLISSVVLLGNIAFKYRLIIWQLLKAAENVKFSWLENCKGLFKRYAVSFLCGYFIFQFYTPFVLYLEGPIKAGAVGLSLNMAMAVYNFANTWVYIKTPMLNMHASKKEWSNMDRHIKQAVFRSGVTYIISVIGLIPLLMILNHFMDIFNRMIAIEDFVFLLLALFMQIIVNALATYLRAHKFEFLVLPSITTAIYVVAITYASIRVFNSKFIFLGFLTSYFWGLPWVISIFKEKRRVLHS